MSDSKTLDDIKANEVVTMTRTWSLLFQHAGCDPTCHGCNKKLPPGCLFKLATVETRGNASKEVMLCDVCTPASVKKAKKAADKEWAAKVKAGTAGCYRINGKIVP